MNMYVYIVYELHKSFENVNVSNIIVLLRALLCAYCFEYKVFQLARNLNMSLHIC